MANISLKIIKKN